MTLYTRCIFDPPSPEDGLRICIMSRLTQNDGRTPDLRLVTGKAFDEWKVYLAPDPLSVGKWYRSEKTPQDWKDFTEAYGNLLKTESIERRVIELTHQAMREDLTLLCVEKDHQFCHRGLLAERCKLYIPSLIVIHR